MSSSSFDLNSILTALGAKSGLDVSSTVGNLIYAARAPERQWQAQQSTISTQKQYLEYYNSLASTLSDKLNSLQDPIGALTTMSATSSQTDIVTASAAAGTAAGNHIVVVDNLASTAAWYSDSKASATTTLDAGSFTLKVGSADAVTINVGGTSTVKTLQDLATYINGQSLGVKASIVNDSKGARVAIVSNTSGDAGDITITPNGVNFTQAVQGKNASLTVDGIPISSASNTVTGAVNGLTLNLTGSAVGKEVTISVQADRAAATQAVNDFVDAYNTLITQVNAQFKYNEATKSTGIMATDSAVRMFQADLLSMASYYTGTPTDAVSNLGALGVTMKDDGTLAVDSTKLETVMEDNFSAVQKFFQGTNSDGFAKFLNNKLDVYTDSTEGAFSVDLKTISEQYDNLQDEVDHFETYISSEQTRLTTYYNNVNVQLQQMTAQIDQIKAMLDTGSSNK